MKMNTEITIKNENDKGNFYNTVAMLRNHSNYSSNFVISGGKR